MNTENLIRERYRLLDKGIYTGYEGGENEQKQELISNHNEEREGRIMVQMHNRAADFNYKTRGMTLAAKEEYRKSLEPLVILETKVETKYSFY